MGRAALVGLVVAGAVFTLVMVADGGDDPPARATSSPPTRGLDVFMAMGCGSCHRLAAASSTGRIGPDLDERLGGHTRASLRKKILDPAAGQRYTTMPDDFGERMSEAELDALLDFLLAARS